MTVRLALAALLLAAACQPGKPAPAAAGAPAGAPDLTVRAESGAPVLRLDEGALLFTASWPDPASGDRQTLELVTPDGHVYQRLEAPLGRDGTASARVPVRGTGIEDYRMTGTWRLRAYRNVAATPAAELAFAIEAR
jgi:hypothetical protein